MGQARNLVGIYRLCLTDKTVNFVKLNSDVAAVVLQLMNVRRCGHSENFFFIEVGRSAMTGPGEFWMQVEDSVVAQNMHETLLEAMKALSEEFRQRSKSQTVGVSCGGGTASNPISVPSRRHHPNLPPSQVGFSRRARTETPGVSNSNTSPTPRHGFSRSRTASIGRVSMSGSPSDYGSSDEYGSSPGEHSLLATGLPAALVEGGASYILMGHREGSHKRVTAPPGGDEYMAMTPNSSVSPPQHIHLPISEGYMLMSPNSSCSPDLHGLSGCNWGSRGSMESRTGSDYMNMSPISARSACSTPPSHPEQQPLQPKMVYSYFSLPRSYKHTTLSTRFEDDLDRVSSSESLEERSLSLSVGGVGRATRLSAGHRVGGAHPKVSSQHYHQQRCGPG
uniref:Si:ch211-284e13.4 n=1 Tax=Cyprinus carpio TaxID=7962 RepID=A0A8C2FDV7_CYPCA